MTTSIDEHKLHELRGRAIVDFDAVSIAPLVRIGDRLELYRALASGGSSRCPLAQEVGLVLAAQAGEALMRAVGTSAGFTRFRRATQTPLNVVYEARP